MCEKTQLRKQYKELRKSLHSEQKDRRIEKNAWLHFRSGESFFVYLSFGTEVGTDKLIAQFLKNGKRVCVPRIVGEDMLAVPFTDKLERGALGIMQPSEGEDTPCAVAFVPLLAVDREGHRLGYGGGYYDRYFEKHPEILKIGLAYEAQFVEKLPLDEWDIPLDGIVTERVVHMFRR